jgi:predicted RNA binding protein YcfA (HicA-like mRNA interferase family)
MIHTMTSKDLIAELEANGWVLARVRGSHHVYRHADNPNIITVPHPKKDLGKGLVNNLRKLAGLK